MRRAIICASVVSMSVASAGQPSAKLQLKYLGTAGWEISDGRTTILIDPYLSRLHMTAPSNDHVADRDQFRRFMMAADKRYRVHAREAVEDLDHPLRFYTLTEALIRRGYTNEQVKLVIGGNFQRVLSQVWL